MKMFLRLKEPKQGNAPAQVNLVEEGLEVESEDEEVLEIEGGIALPDVLDVEMLEVNLEDEVLKVEEQKENQVLVNQDEEMVEAEGPERKSLLLRCILMWKF